MGRGGLFVTFSNCCAICIFEFEFVFFFQIIVFKFIYAKVICRIGK